jgi:cytochrome c553
MTESNRTTAMKRLLCAPLVIALLFSAGSAFASGDVDAGKAKAVPCQACHGQDGNAGVDPQYPHLAGQYADYLARALHEYKLGQRKNPIMVGFATPLSDADIEDLAAYFASLPDGKLTDLHGHIQGD